MTRDTGTPSPLRLTLMRRSIALSLERMRENRGGPFGAVIAKDGKIVAEGSNLVTSTNDPTAHAEIVAIRNACAALCAFSLAGCEMYASCEPCPMCLSAAYLARIDRVYYGNTRHDAADIGFDDAFLYTEVARDLESRHIPTIRMLADEARAAFDEWRAKPDKVPY